MTSSTGITYLRCLG